MKNKFYLLLAIITLGLIGFYNFDIVKLTIMGSKDFVLNSKKDEIYENLLLVKKYKSETEFRNLISYLLSAQNVDLLSKEMAIRYAREQNKIEYLNELKIMQKYFKDIPKDSVWIFKINESEYRSNKLNGAQIVIFLDETIKRLE